MSRPPARGGRRTRAARFVVATLNPDKLRELAALMHGIMLWFMLQSNLDEGRTWLGHGLAAGSTVDAVTRGARISNHSYGPDSLTQWGDYETESFPLAADPTVLWHALKERQPDVVFNLFEGNLHNPETESYVTGLMEWFGVPHTGSPLTTLTLARAKHLTKYVLKGAGLATADFFAHVGLARPRTADQAGPVWAMFASLVPRDSAAHGVVELLATRAGATSRARPGRRARAAPRRPGQRLPAEEGLARAARGLRAAPVVARGGAPPR